MPQLPDLTRSQRPTPRPATQVVEMPTRTGFENIPAQAMEQISHTLGTLSEEVFKRKERQDALLVEHSVNDLLYKTADIEKAYKDRLGVDATAEDFPDKYLSEFDAATESIIEKLPSPVQQEGFRRRADILRLRLNRGLLTHKAQQTLVAAEQTAQASEELAVLNSGNNGAEAWARGDVSRAIRNRREADSLQGVPPEATEVKIQQMMDEAYTAVISKAIADEDVTGAVEWAEKAKTGQTVDGTTYKMSAAAEAQIAVALDQFKTGSVTDRIELITDAMQKAIRHGESASQYLDRIKEAAQILDPKERQETIKSARQFATMEKLTAPALKKVQKGNMLDAMTDFESLQLADPPEGVSIDDWNQHLDDVGGEVQDILDARQKVRQARAQASLVQNEEAVALLKQRAKTEGVPQAELNAALESGVLSTAEYQSIFSDSQKTWSKRASYADVAKRIAGDPSVVIPPKAANDYYRDYIASRPDEVKVEYADRVKFVPEDLKNEIKSFLFSEDPDLIARAGRMLDEIDQIPGIDIPFSPNERAFAETLTGLEQNMAPAEAMKLARELTDPRDRNRVEMRKAELKDMTSSSGVRKFGDIYDVDDVIDSGIFAFSAPPSAVNKGNMRKEYQTLVDAHYLAGMDLDAAQNKAAQLLARNWKEQDFMGRREAFKYPLKDYYSVDGSIEYAETQLLEEVRHNFFFPEQLEKEDIFLLSDRTTAQEATRGNPSYLVYVSQDGALTPLGVRFRPEVSAAVLERNERLRKLRGSVKTNPLGYEPKAGYL